MGNIAPKRQMIKLDIRVDDEIWFDRLTELERVTEQAVKAAFHQMTVIDAEVSLMFCDDAAIQDLNRTWRAKDRPTDVLSFPANPLDRPFIGDIALGWGITSQDAAAQGKALDQHVAHLIIHGVLHLLGHDHLNDTEAEEMERLEQAALASLGWPDPYSQMPNRLNSYEDRHD